MALLVELDVVSLRLQPTRTGGKISTKFRETAQQSESGRSGQAQDGSNRRRVGGRRRREEGEGDLPWRRTLELLGVWFGSRRRKGPR
jgi:hypothetical protein